MPQAQARDLWPAFGAEIEGVELQVGLDDETCRFLRRVFDDRGALLFRGVELDRTAQLYLSEVLMGHEPPSAEEAEAATARQGNFWISNKEPAAAAPFGRLLFHCDGMWSADPFEVLSLYGVEVEPPVVPTMFASAAKAWETLPDALKARVEGLQARHVTGPEYLTDRRRGEFADELVQPVRGHSPMSTTPIGHEHPRTGRTLLYVTQGMTKEIVGLSPDESEDLLEELFAHLYRPENVGEHEWREGDLVVWDNLAVQHARSNVLTEGPARTLRKIGLPLGESQAQVQTYQSVGAAS
jgi:taurine dioxygenase